MTTTQQAPQQPARPLIKTFWLLHRTAYRITGGRFGLQRPERGAKFGMLRLRTTGRRTGKARTTMVGYFEDGSNLVTLAMNGWGEAEPAWWLNLQARPEATVETKTGRRRVRARAADGAERERLWAHWRELDPGLDGYASRRPTETAVVILEPVEDGPRR